MVRLGLRGQKAEGVTMPEGMPLDELALRILTAASLAIQAAGETPRLEIRSTLEQD